MELDRDELGNNREGGSEQLRPGFPLKFARDMRILWFKRIVEGCIYDTFINFMQTMHFIHAAKYHLTDVPGSKISSGEASCSICNSNLTELCGRCEKCNDFVCVWCMKKYDYETGYVCADSYYQAWRWYKNFQLLERTHQVTIETCASFSICSLMTALKIDSLGGPNFIYSYLE